uniref:Integrase core domain containing protein n=1 Tax=Solanum tuberosum TaxID=4113 RepID=M1DLE0_SOLTU
MVGMAVCPNKVPSKGSPSRATLRLMVMTTGHGTARGVTLDWWELCKVEGATALKTMGTTTSRGTLDGLSGLGKLEGNTGQGTTDTTTSSGALDDPFRWAWSLTGAAQIKGNEMPQLIERDVLAAKKEIKDEMQKELVVLKDRMGGLENLAQDRFKVAAEEFGEEIHADLSIEKKRQEKKACKVSWKAAREKEAREQQQRDTVLLRASGSGVPIPASGSQPDHMLSSESAPVDRGVDADPITGA